MKTQLISRRSIVLLSCGLAMLLSAAHSQAQITTNWWIYNGNQGGSPGSNWNNAGAVAYWKLNNAGTAAIPTNGSVTSTTTNYNFYSLTNNGTQAGNGNTTALIRNPYSTGTPNVVSFPGDTLILQTNASIRFKNLGGVGTFVTGANYATPTNVFPGNYGLPGLILNGGILNNGTSGTAFVIQGSIYANPGSQSYLNPADTFNQDSVTRPLIFQAQLTGSGALALLNGASSTTANFPVPFTGTSNNFTGQWIVKSGWLQGAGDGTSDGYNSLGTNPAVSFDIDPLWAPPQGGLNGVTNGNYGFVNNGSTGGSNAFFYNGPAVLDMGAGLANSGGSLTLTNGGTLYLHGNVIFSNVIVEGYSIPPGTYSYATLVSMFATIPGYNANFAPAGTPFASPFGTLTVQRYGPPLLPASISVQPISDILYPTRNAVFTVTSGGTAPLTYRWYKVTQTTSNALSDGGNISGSATNQLNISGVSSSDAATYFVIVTNALASVVSSNVTLAVVNAVEPYEIAVSNLNPVAYYQFNETNNPANGNVPAFDYAGGHTGTYGISLDNGSVATAGPQSPAFPGFFTTNYAAQFNGDAAGNVVRIPALNLNTNSVTMIAWLNPGGVQSSATGIIFCRGNNTVAGLDYTGTFSSINNAYDLGYTWNNDPATYNWDSGLTAPSFQWSMVSLVVTPTNATIYMMNASGLSSSSHPYAHIVQAFDTNNTTQIGEDSNDGGSGTRSFLGAIDEVSVFNSALTGDQLAGLFYTATGTTNYTPVIGLQPVSTSVYVGQTFQLTVGAYGSEPLTYQWASAATGSGGPYVNLTDGNGIVGSSTPTLTFQSATLAQAKDYVCKVSNTATPSTVQSTAATVTVLTANPPIFNITMSTQEASGSDWNTGSYWSDGNPASVSAISEPGSFYELLPGALMRTPGGTVNSAFPGKELIVDGNGVWINAPAAGTAQAEIRNKQPEPTVGNATVYYPLLIMNGGQMDNGNGGLVEIQGNIQILSNTVIYVDSGGGTGRAYQIDSYLTGSANIEYHDFDASLSGGLNITCPTNAYTGTWNIVQGPLLGSGSNSLGTNTITIGATGTLQTFYNINNTNSSLNLTGRMFLTQTDTFNSVFLGNVPMPAGTYTAGVLSSNYPAYFPSNWISYLGVTNTSAVGSLTVLHTPGPSILIQPVSLTIYPTQTAQFTVTAGGTPTLGYRWASNNVFLTDGGNISGSQTPTLTLANTVAAEAGSYTVVVTNSLSGATSQVATLTFLPTYPAVNPITLNLSEPAGDDWNTVGVWTDPSNGLPASVSALVFPGSTYLVPAGTLLRTPIAAIPQTNFPGVQLTVAGNGVWVDLPNSASPVGELRFKQGVNGGIIYFPLLIMAGGQWDNGNASSLAVVMGQIDIVSNTPVYADDSGSTGVRPYQIGGYLTGNGSIEYHDSDATFGGYLSITGSTNTFTGTWNIVAGPLLGSGLNSLGTNSITIGTNGGLETLYDIHSPNATLSLSNGAIMYLHQNDNFATVNINGVNLAAGTYTFAQLHTAYPATFPASWNAIANSSFTSGSGSIIVGAAPPQVTLFTKFSPGSLTLTWSQGLLLQAPLVTGPWTTNAAATSPYTINPTNAQQYFQIQVVP